MEKAKVIFFGLTHLSHFQSFRQNGTSAQACRYRTASFTRQLYRHQDTFRRTGQSGIHPPQLCSAYGQFTPQFRSQTFPDRLQHPIFRPRSNAVDHLQSAMENGFKSHIRPMPGDIADGVKGTDYREIPIDGEYCPTPKIGTAIADADIIISMNHFKGHEQTGFGGALKNLGMGCASVGGKLELHASSQPKIDTGNCIGCNICVKHCAHDAIHLNAERKAEIDYAKCVGCGQCVALCQHDAAVVSDWDTSERLNYKIAEYSAAVLKDKPHFHISFIMNVSPECDCWNHNDAAIIPDLGMLASADPVALDKACADLVIQSPHFAWK